LTGSKSSRFNSFKEFPFLTLGWKETDFCVGGPGVIQKSNPLGLGKIRRARKSWWKAAGLSYKTLNLTHFSSGKRAIKAINRDQSCVHLAIEGATFFQNNIVLH
jgi:hypothetical protein